MLAVRMLLKTLVISLMLLPALAFAGAGKIEELGIGSTVKVMRAGAAIKLKKGDSLESGDELSTDANTSVDIRLEDETLIRVGVSSTYKVQEDSKIHALVHRLLSGVVRVMVKPNEKDGQKDAAIKFRMYTPEGTIGVRGTEFVVIRTDGQTELKGLDGVVVFGPAETDFANASEFVKVERGFHSSIHAKSKVGKPEKFDLGSYKNLINSRNGVFGPLAGRSGGSNKYARSETANAAPSVPSQGAGNAPKRKEVAEVPKLLKKKTGDKPDYQYMLYQAAQNGDVDAAKLAVKNGANVNAKGEIVDGHTPLQLAMLFKQEKMFEFLILNGADVDMKNKQGLTPLMFVASEHLDMDFARALVNPGAADLDIENKEGLTAEKIAKVFEYKELADYLGSDEADRDYVKAKQERDKRETKKK